MDPRTLSAISGSVVAIGAAVVGAAVAVALGVLVRVGVLLTVAVGVLVAVGAGCLLAATVRHTFTRFVWPCTFFFTLWHTRVVAG